ncbi:MAG: magnesium-translocating P-type ATPase [Candidatus Micrarchaeota archaeon]
MAAANSNPALKVLYWALPIPEVLSRLGTSENGLSLAEAQKRLMDTGKNRIAKQEKRHSLSILVSQFTNPLVLILVLAAIVAFFFGETLDAAVILVIVVVNAVLGFFQEYKAEKALEELEKFVVIKSKVLRGGDFLQIDSQEIVGGDIVFLNIGDLVPADIRLIQSEELTMDESVLTGESVPVLKHTSVLPSGHSLPQYLENMAFMGTTVSGGYGHGVVTATGSATFFGKTASFLKSESDESQFQKNIGQISNLLVKVIICMTLFVFLANTVLGKGAFDSFLFAIALAVGITPEALPIVMTISLSHGAVAMARQKVVVKKLASMEDLGNMDILCSDKTGTLTEGEIRLHDFVCADGSKNEHLIVDALMCSEVQIGKHHKAFSNPLDKAIWESPLAKSVEHHLVKFLVLEKNEFDFSRKRMSVLVKQDLKNRLIVKGAAEFIFRQCTKIESNGKTAALTSALLSKMHQKVEEFEKQGFRVIAVAEKETAASSTVPADETDLVLTGFLLFLDPPKKTAKEALHHLRQLGVDVKIISGDSPLVTRTVCQEVGFALVDDRIVTGDELDGLSEEELAGFAGKFNAFARVTPEHKLSIVHALKKQGHIVGFLGDGINDAPALKAADVGISVDSAAGIARESADIILLKKALRVIADGIIEGRKTFANINKYLLNTISANYGNMFTVALSSLFLKFIPLLPSQILLNNFVSDIPMLAVSTDNVDASLLKKPRKYDNSALSKAMVFFGVISSVFDLILIGTLLLVLGVATDVFRTAWFVESALSEIVVVFALRTQLAFYKSRPSMLLLATSIGTGLVAVLIIFTSFGQQLFRFVGLPASVLALIAGILVFYFVTVELAKRYFFKKYQF